MSRCWLVPLYNYYSKSEDEWQRWEIYRLFSSSVTRVSVSICQFLSVIPWFDGSQTCNTSLVVFEDDCCFPCRSAANTVLYCMFCLELPEHHYWHKALWIIEGVSPTECQAGKGTQCWHGNCGFMRKGVIRDAKQTSLFLHLWNPKGRFPCIVLTLHYHSLVKGHIKVILTLFSWKIHYWRWGVESNQVDHTCTCTLNIPDRS